MPVEIIETLLVISIHTTSGVLAFMYDMEKEPTGSKASLNAKR
ncbi:hypothetical protein [Geobacillus thermodenitrificans]|nr:hypothetical protein [Geobacillus thermodenitrificans]